MVVVARPDHVAARQGQPLNFIEAGVRHCSQADPSTEFGQTVARALDRGTDSADWVALTGDRADISSCRRRVNAG